MAGEVPLITGAAMIQEISSLWAGVLCQGTLCSPQARCVSGFVFSFGLSERDLKCLLHLYLSFHSIVINILFDALLTAFHFFLSRVLKVYKKWTVSTGKPI